MVGKLAAQMAAQLAVLWGLSKAALMVEKKAARWDDSLAGERVA